MNQKILNFLNKINDPLTVNRLLVSTFLKHKNTSTVKNNKINKLVIQESEILYNEFKKFTDILDKVQQKLCFEELLKLFEFVISPSDKLINGAIYTPANIRKYITQESFELLGNKNIDDIKIADIACGCGGFLIDATRELKRRTKKTYKEIYKDNIYGVDIQPYSVNRTEILLALLAIAEGEEDEEEFIFNIHTGDTLKYDWKDIRFDMILGNPPYVCSRNMNEGTKKLMKNWSTCKTGHPDLYIPFFSDRL